MEDNPNFILEKYTLKFKNKMIEHAFDLKWNK